MKNQISIPLPSLHLATAKDAFRPFVNYIQFKRFERPGSYGRPGMYATATDAHILCTANLADHLSNLEELPDEFYMKPDQYKLLTGSKVSYLSFSESTIQTFDKSGEPLNIASFVPAEKLEFRYPDWPSVLPIFWDYSEDNNLRSNFSVDSKLLCRLAQVMDRAPIVLRFNRHSISAMYGEPQENGYTICLVMERKISDPDAYFQQIAEHQAILHHSYRLTEV